MSGALTFTKAAPFRPQIAPGGGPTLADAVEHAATSFMTWRDHERAASTAAGLLDPETGWPTRKGWMAAGMAYAQGLGTSNVGAIRAFHGSPHSFDAFDLGKIGTGEGAQAYGHGMYFAGKEGVAQSYRDALSGDAATNAIDGFLRRNRGVNLRPEEVVEGLKGTPAAALATDPAVVDSIRKLLPNYMPNLPITGTDLTHYRKINDAAERMIPGHMYEANLHADPEHLLDWDKPLSQQSPKVREFFETPAIGIGPETTGAEAYRMLGRGQEPNLSAAMHHSGIPGIRYLDGGSRSAGEGTHNYVMFDPANIEIIRKYGVPALIGGAAAAGLAAPAAADTLPGMLHLDERVAPKVPPGSPRPFAPGEWLDNPDGSWSSELSVTATHPGMNGGQPTILPSLWLVNGKPVRVSHEQAVEYAKQSGLNFAPFKSVDEAEVAAQQREMQWQGLQPKDAGRVAPLWQMPAAPAATAPDLTFTRAVPTFTKVDNAATAVGGSGAGGGTDGAAVQPVAPPAGVPAALSLPG